MGIALAKLYDFVWSDFCDWYIELTKPVLYGDDEAKRTQTLSVLIHVLGETLKLLHPFVPFVTEEIYQNLPKHGESLMIEEFPRYNAKNNYPKQKSDMEAVMEIVKSVRNIRAQVGAAPSKKVRLYVKTDKKKLVKDTSLYIEKLAGVQEIVFIESKGELKEKTVSQLLEGFELYIPLGELVDAEKEIARLKGELEKAENEIVRANAKLANNGFLEKAPKTLVDKEREKLNKFIELRKKIMREIKEFE